MSPPEAPQSKQQQKIPGCGDSEGAGLSKSAKRNMKRKEKRKQQQQQGQDENAEEDSVGNTLDDLSISESSDKMGAAAAAAAVSVPSPDDSSAAAAEKAKKIKNLKKKLRQVEELQQKVDSGEIKDPTKDQLEKLARALILQAELQQLERDSWSNNKAEEPDRLHLNIKEKKKQKKNRERTIAGLRSCPALNTLSSLETDPELWTESWGRLRL